MTKPDFVSFDASLYSVKVASLDNSQLQRKEVLKIGSAYSGGFGVAGGVVLAPVTAGVTIVGAAAGARTWQVASQKLEIIQAEMKTKGLPLHKEMKRDSAIPAVFSGFTEGLKMAVGVEGSAAGWSMGEAANKAPKSGEGSSRLVSKESWSKVMSLESLTRMKTAPSRMMGT
jgi:hypothetical protein